MGCAWSAVGTISGFSTTLAVGFSTGLSSPIFSTSGFGASAFGAVRTPCVICEKSAAEMMSVDRNSGGGVFSGRVANVIRPHASTPACKTADMVHPAFIGQEPCSTSVTSATRRKPAAESRPITRITVP